MINSTAGLPQEQPHHPPTSPTPARDAFLLRVLETEHLACPVCGYDLHRLTQPRCTECGRPLALQVRVPSSMQWAWVAAMVASAAWAGLGLLMALMLARFGNAPPGMRSMRELLMPPGVFWDCLYFLTLASIAAPPILLATRLRFAALSPALQ